jgi:ABC-type transport system involved in multi-copper enzyme maturation permease subunit
VLWWVLVARELQAAARRVGTWWWRTAGALGLSVLVMVLALPPILSEPPAAQGEWLFQFLLMAVWLCCWLAGAVLTAESVAREREEGTLGLLFLTELSSGSVVAGKMAAGSLQALGAVVAVTPLLALPMLLGGVEWGEWLRTALVCLVTMWVSLSLGLLCSTFLPRAQSAVFFTFAGLIFVTVVLPLAGTLVIGALGFPVDELPALLTPVGGVFLSRDSAYRAGPGWFWAWVAVQFALGLCALWMTRARLTRLWHETAVSTRAISLHPRWRSLPWRGLRIVQDLRVRAQCLDRAPYAWRLLRSRADRLMPWAVMASLECLWGWIAYGFDEPELAWALILFLLPWLMKGVLLMQATYSLAEDRRNGAAELVSTTAVGPEGLWQGHLLALGRIWLWPSLVLTIAMALIWWRWGIQHEVFDLPLFGWTVLLWTDMLGLALVGTYLAFSGRSAVMSMILTALIIWGIPWFMALAWGSATFVAQFVDLISPDWSVDPAIELWVYHAFRAGLALMAAGWAWSWLQRWPQTRRGSVL